MLEGGPFPEILLNKCEMLVSLEFFFDVKWLDRNVFSHLLLFCLLPLELSRVSEMDIYPSVQQTRKYIVYQNVLLTFSFKIFLLKESEG